MKTSKGRRVCLVCLLVVFFVLARAPVSLAKEDSLQKLYEAAKADREVIWQFSGALKPIKPVIDGFQKKFPDINLSTISVGAAVIPSRIIVESSAKRLTVDVGTAFPVYMMPVVERDLLAAHNWAQMADVDPKRVLFDGRFVSFSDAPRVWAYNTKLVSKAEAPKTWEDTLSPKWKGGKIGVRAAPSGLNNLFPVWKRDKQKAMDYLKQLAKQEVVPGTRDAEVANRVATGESPIAILSMTSVVPAVAEGAPLALCPIGPTASDSAVFWIPKGSPHPNAAKLLVAWLATSPDARRELIKGGRGVSYPPDASPQAKMLADNGIGFYSIESPEDIREYAGPFAEAVVKIMGFKPE